MENTLQQFDPDNRKFGSIMIGTLCVVIVLFIIASRYLH
ncbi:MAG: hypothetical protein K0Q79_390 [Flavipsychrobacter sp.]|jgi:hypothetical protein|nr:hypothetical protein [Flavipsychrobacter sp.]